MAKGLQPIRHPQMDFFIADILDAAPKDDLSSMEHPFFALNPGDMETRRYEHRGNWIELTPSSKGLATQHDKDILIYLSSQLIEAMNRGRDVSRTVRLTAYDFLVTVNRPTAGIGYTRLKEALHRLRNTSIETNIKNGDYITEEGFGWIDDWEIVRLSKNGRMESIEISLSKWLWKAIESHEVLTISRDYFRLRKPIDRRVYELIRKHCGAQRRWQVGMDVLHRKTGSKSNIREFRRLIRAMVQSNHLPDYRIRFNESKDLFTAYIRNERGGAAQVLDTLKDGGVNLDDVLHQRKRGKRERYQSREADKTKPSQGEVEPPTTLAPMTEQSERVPDDDRKGEGDPPKVSPTPAEPEAEAERPAIEHPVPAPDASDSDSPPAMAAAGTTEPHPDPPESVEATRALEAMRAAVGLRPRNRRK